MQYVVALLLVLEGLGSGTLLISQISTYGVYDGPTLAVLAVRGALGILQFAAGWLIVRRLPIAAGFASIVLVASAALRTAELGFGAAPTNIFPTYRWPIAAAYWAYAITCILVLRPGRAGKVRHSQL
jgi:hypothetical protein